MSRIKRGVSTHPNQVPDATGEITCRTILIISDIPLSEKNVQNRIRIHVVQWTNQIIPVLEKRRIYLLKKGGERYYRQMGITLEDLKIIASRQDDIKAALQS